MVMKFDNGGYLANFKCQTFAWGGWRSRGINRKDCYERQRIRQNNRMTAIFEFEISPPVSYTDTHKNAMELSLEETDKHFITKERYSGDGTCGKCITSASGVDNEASNVTNSPEKKVNNSVRNY